MKTQTMIMLIVGGLLLLAIAVLTGCTSRPPVETLASVVVPEVFQLVPGEHR